MQQNKQILYLVLGSNDNHNNQLIQPIAKDIQKINKHYVLKPIYAYKNKKFIQNYNITEAPTLIGEGVKVVGVANILNYLIKYKPLEIKSSNEKIRNWQLELLQDESNTGEDQEKEIDTDSIHKKMTKFYDRRSVLLQNMKKTFNDKKPVTNIQNDSQFLETANKTIETSYKKETPVDGDVCLSEYYADVLKNTR